MGGALQSSICSQSCPNRSFEPNLGQNRFSYVNTTRIETKNCGHYNLLDGPVTNVSLETSDFKFNLI